MQAVRLFCLITSIRYYLRQGGYGFAFVGCLITGGMRKKLPTNFDVIFGGGGLYGWQHTKQMLLVIWSHDADPGLLIREFLPLQKRNS